VTHSELVQRAERWLSGTMRCCPVITECNCWATQETPDAFGVNSDGTVVVECKVSLRDFYADWQKPFRRKPWTGMGRLRFYMTPPRVISPNRLVRAPGWGLLEVRKSIVRVITDSQVFHQSGNREALLMRSAWLKQESRP